MTMDRRFQPADDDYDDDGNDHVWGFNKARARGRCCQFNVAGPGAGTALGYSMALQQGQGPVSSV